MLKSMAMLCEKLLQRRQEYKHIGLTTRIAHEPNTPDLPFEGAKPRSDLDPKSIEQAFANDRIINARGNANRVQLRQRVSGLSGILNVYRRKPGLKRLLVLTMPCKTVLE